MIVLGRKTIIPRCTKLQDLPAMSALDAILLCIVFERCTIIATYAWLGESFLQPAIGCTSIFPGLQRSSDETQKYLGCTVTYIFAGREVCERDTFCLQSLTQRPAEPPSDVISCNRIPYSEGAVSKHVALDSLRVVVENQVLLCRKESN